MVTKDLCTYWYCAAGSCEDKATHKILLGEYVFVTVCTHHIVMYKYIMGGKIVKLFPNEGLPVGWEFVRDRYRWRGAYKKGSPGEVQYAKRR